MATMCIGLPSSESRRTQQPLTSEFRPHSASFFLTANSMPIPALENKLLVSSGLLAEPHFRRLLKFQARRREGLVGNDLEIRTTANQVFICEDDNSSWFTVYCMHIHRRGDTLSRAEDHHAEAGHQGPWVLKKRYSELETFRRLLLKHIAEWESAVQNEFSSKTSIDSQKTLALVSNAMRRAISPTFPRKRMRADTPATVNERIEGLPSFVRKLLGVYTDLSVYRTNSQLQAGGFAASYAQLCTIYTELEAFLEIPQRQKDAENRRQSAVLALQDFKKNTEPVDGSSSDQLCSICLNENEDPLAQDTRPMVSLPCNHHFHEDCVIDWFGTSMTCPLCRRSSYS